MNKDAGGNDASSTRALRARIGSDPIDGVRIAMPRYTAIKRSPY